MKLGDAEIGQKVVRTGPTFEYKEYGVITGRSIAWIFVKYDGDKHSKATAASELEIVNEGNHG